MAADAEPFGKETPRIALLGQKDALNFALYQLVQARRSQPIEVLVLTPNDQPAVPCCADAAAICASLGYEHRVASKNYMVLEAIQKFRPHLLAAPSDCSGSGQAEARKILSLGTVGACRGYGKSLRPLSARSASCHGASTTDLRSVRCAVRMDLELLRSRSGGDRVAFDLLKRWISNAFLREVRDTAPAGCPWQSLTRALEESRRRRWREARSEGTDLELDPITEADLRKSLVHAYKELLPELFQPFPQIFLWPMPESVLRVVAEAKLKDELSIFQLGHFPDTGEVLEHWKWYLFCLTFESREFTSNGVHWDKHPDLAYPCIVRVPLDFVDLQILARIFKVQITVSRMGREALRLLPSEEDGCEEIVHLVMHGGLWAPVLGSRPPLREVDFVGAVVQLGHDLHCFEAFAEKTACILDFDEVQDFCRACVGRHIIPVQRERICKIVACDGTQHHPRYRIPQVELIRRESRRQRASLDGPGPGDAPSFHGIPDGSLEFQVLLDLVTQLVCERLCATRWKIEGEPPAKLDDYARYLDKLAYLAPLPPVEIIEMQLTQPYLQRMKGSSSEDIAPGRRSVEEVVQMLEPSNGPSTVWIQCPSSFRPLASQRNNLLSCEAGDWIGLTGLGREYPDGSRLLLAKPAGLKGVPRWILSDVISRFAVREEFAPSPSWPYPQEFLTLKNGDLVQVTDRPNGQWQGWARGKLWKSHGDQEPVLQEGLFPLHCGQPELWVKSWLKERSEASSPLKVHEDESGSAPYPPRPYSYGHVRR
eukprot:s4831_g2.t1